MLEYSRFKLTRVGNPRHFSVGEQVQLCSIGSNRHRQVVHHLGIILTKIKRTIETKTKTRSTTETKTKRTTETQTKTKIKTKRQMQSAPV